MILSPADCEAAINAIVERREALIMQWASNPSRYIPDIHAGLLERMASDLRQLRRLQADSGGESTNHGAEPQIAGNKKHLPDWLLEHQND